MGDNELKVVFWNARGILSKIEEYKNYLYDTKVDISCVCETFIKGTNSINIRGYKSVVENRVSGRLGGLLILVKESIDFVRLPTPKTRLLECLSVKIKSVLYPGGGITITLVYLPGKSTDRDINKYYEYDLKLISNECKNYFMIGDFNSRHANWNCPNTNRAGTVLNNFLNNSNAFINFPDEHTYCPLSDKFSHSTIDLIITDGRTRHTKPNIITDFHSDHYPVRFEIKQFTADKVSTSRPCYRLANWSLFKKVLDDKLTSMTNETSIDCMISQLTSSIIDAQNVAVPVVKPGKDNVLIDDALREKIKERNYYRRRYNRTHMEYDKLQCNSLNKYIQARIKELKVENFSRILTDPTNNRKSIFSIIRGRKSLTKLPTKADNQEALLTNKDKADHLAKYFMSAHENPLENDNRSFTTKIDYVVGHHLSRNGPTACTVVQVSDVQRIIHNLKINKSPGTDSIPNRLIKSMTPKSTRFLTNIYNTCLLQGIYPDSWKEAIVIPIPKPDKDHTIASGYRPISLLCAFAKIFEKIINDRLIESTHDKIPDFQFGFRRGHSTSHQLERVHTYITDRLEISDSIGMITMDIEKAFDRVWHNGLLFKLIKNKVPDYLIQIVSSFLTNRKFRVKVGDSLSMTGRPRFGLPQGSVLAPSLYNIYTADLPSINSQIAVYADDTAIYNSSRFVRQIETGLDRDYKKLTKYFTLWKTKINMTKTQAIFFTRRTKKQLPTDTIRLNNIDINWTSTIKYLGLHFDNKLTFDFHINETLKKIDKIIRVLYPVMNLDAHTDRRTKIILYQTYLRPILTYGFPVLRLASRTQLKKLQIKQNKILRLILNAPFDRRTKLIHDESAIAYLSDFMTRLSKKYYERAKVSPNVMIRDLVPR